VPSPGGHAFLVYTSTVYAQGGVRDGPIEEVFSLLGERVVSIYLVRARTFCEEYAAAVIDNGEGAIPHGMTSSGMSIWYSRSHVNPPGPYRSSSQMLYLFLEG
jgi:hypothetical protein